MVCTVSEQACVALDILTFPSSAHIPCPIQVVAQSGKPASRVAVDASKRILFVSSDRFDKKCRMDLAMDILMAAGLAAAVGIRPFLPAVAVGLIARADLRLNVGEFDFLTSWPFLAALCALAVAFWVLEAMVKKHSSRRAVALGIGFASVVLGAALFAAVLSSGGHSVLPGIFAGAVIAAVARMAVVVFLASAASRVRDSGAKNLFFVYLEPIAVLIAVLAVLIPPVSVVVIAAFIYVLVSVRKKSQSKYEGLRILR